MDLISKVENALAQTKTLMDIDYIRERIETTDKINRRTKQGRELTDQLLDLVSQKEQELIKNLEPFYG